MLIGKRIFLRAFLEKDAPVLLKWGQNDRYHKLAGFAHYQNMAQAKKGACQYSKRPYSYAICLRGSGQVIGLVELYERGLDVQSGLLRTKEIGFMLDQAYERQGYMTEALTLVIGHAFAQLKQVEIWAGVFPGNSRSIHLLKRLGFHYVYMIDYRQISHLLTYQEKYYLLKKEDWLKMKTNTKS